MVQYILIHSEASELADTAVLRFGVYVLLDINLENPAYVFLLYRLFLYWVS